MRLIKVSLLLILSSQIIFSPAVSISLSGGSQATVDGNCLVSGVTAATSILLNQYHSIFDPSIGTTATVQATVVGDKTTTWSYSYLLSKTATSVTASESLSANKATGIYASGTASNKLSSSVTARTDVISNQASLASLNGYKVSVTAAKTYASATQSFNSASGYKLSSMTYALNNERDSSKGWVKANYLAYASLTDTFSASRFSASAKSTSTYTRADVLGITAAASYDLDLEMYNTNQDMGSTYTDTGFSGPGSLSAPYSTNYPAFAYSSKYYGKAEAKSSASIYGHVLFGTAYANGLQRTILVYGPGIFNLRVGNYAWTTPTLKSATAAYLT